MTAFSIGDAIGAIDEDSLTVSVTVPAGTDTSALIAAFENTGAKGAGGEQEPDERRNSQRASPLEELKVIAENGDSRPTRRP